MKLLLLYLLIGVVAGCIHKGKTYKDGEEWIDREVFKLRCQHDADGSWRSHVVACVTTSGITVAVNSTVKDGGSEWACYIGVGRQATMLQTAGKFINCAGGHAYGDVWIDNPFQFECAENGITKLQGCMLDWNGNKIGPGEYGYVKERLVQCVLHKNGTIEYLVYPKHIDASCTDDAGIKHPTGTKWVEKKHFEKMCAPYGKAVITGCKVHRFEDELIPVNSMRIFNDLQYHCEKNGRVYTLYSKIDEETVRREEAVNEAYRQREREQNMKRMEIANSSSSDQRVDEEITKKSMHREEIANATYFL